MRVSVVIPTFNRPETLLRALRAVRQQQHENWEALVVDDGDGRGLAAARRLEDGRVQALENEGRGQVAARNTALNRAQGDVIALLDDDDWWEDRNHLSRVIAALEETPALVHRPCWLVHEAAGSETHRKLYDLPASPVSLRDNNTLIASSVAYPRALHDELGLFDEGVGSYWDWDWFLRVAGAGYPLLRLPSPGVCYSVREDSTSAIPDAPARKQNFETFRTKHGLEIVIKNHASLLAESGG